MLWCHYLAHVLIQLAVEGVMWHITAWWVEHGLIGVAVGALHTPTLSHAEHINEVVTLKVVPVQHMLHPMCLLHHVCLLHQLQGILCGVQQLLDRLRRVTALST